MLLTFSIIVFISGKWPRWLEGTMYRVGPGIIQVGDNCYKHPFDMLSVIHKYKLSSEKNKCSYQNKIVDSEVSKTFCWVHLLTLYNDNISIVDLNTIILSTLGEGPNRTQK